MTLEATAKPPPILRAARLHEGPLPRPVCDAATLVMSRHGAIASFLGVIRDHHHGRGVRSLTYHCYRPMAERQLARFLAEAAERFDPLLSAVVVHGIGLIRPGEVALCIHAASARRVGAFDACRFLIERIKQDLPIWKHQLFTDGSSDWAQGS
jgi:molybdopterin synthase catalytic subunit